MPIKPQKKTNSCVIREGIKDKESEEKEEAQTFLHFSSSTKNNNNNENGLIEHRQLNQFY
jgi:hypothetical protein